MLTGAVFEGMDWGTEKVFQQQCDRAEELGISLLILHTELSDVVSITDHQLYHYTIKTTTLSSTLPLHHVSTFTTFLSTLKLNH